MKILSDEVANEIRNRILIKYHKEITDCITQAEQNKIEKPEDAVFFHGVSIAFKHALILFNKIIQKETF